MPNKNKNKREKLSNKSSNKTTNKMFSGKTVKQWRYYVNNISVKCGSGQISVPNERIKSILFIEDFENNVYPYFKITFVLDSVTYYTMIRNKNELEVTLDIRRRYYTLANNDPKGGYTFCKTKGAIRLGTVMTENTEDMLYSQKTSRNSGDYKKIIQEEKYDLHRTDNELTLYLFDMDSFEGTRQTNANAILVNATVADALGYICSKAGLKNVVMAQPDTEGRVNAEGEETPTIETLFIPPLSLLKSFQFIDTYYGIYKSGSLIYFGLDYTYILPFTGRCMARPSSDPCQKVTIIIPKTDDTNHSTALGELSTNMNTEGNEVITCVADYHTVGIRNDSIANNYINANNVQMVDTYSGETVSQSSSAVSRSGNYFKMLENSTENPYIATMYTAKSSALSTVIEVTLSDVNVSWFTPNKEYQVLFEDTDYSSKYSGKFILSKVSHSFIADGDDLVVTTECTLKKIEGE